MNNKKQTKQPLFAEVNLTAIGSFSFREFMTIHYREMGENLYNKVFKSK